MDLSSQPVQLVRMAAASLAIEWVQPKHRIAQVVYLVVAGLAAWQRWWWLVALVVVLALATFAFYRFVLRLIRLIGMPKNVRHTLGGLQDQVRHEFEALDIPTGPLGAALFAYKLARGRQPHAELLAKLPVAAANVQRLIDEATRPGGSAG